MVEHSAGIAQSTLSPRRVARTARVARPQEPASVAAAAPTWLQRVLGRREPTTYQRCLAVHIHFAGPNSQSALR
jgi:hypothetical protein